MTGLQDNYLANSILIVWLLKLMESTYPVDANTAAAISAAVTKNLSDAAYVKDTRRHVLELMPNKKQRSCALSHQLDSVVPGLQASLDSIRSPMTQVNEAQTQVPGTKLEGIEERVMAKLEGIEQRVMAKVDGAFERRTVPPDALSRHEDVPQVFFLQCMHDENGDFMRCAPNAAHFQELPDHIPLLISKFRELNRTTNFNFHVNSKKCFGPHVSVSKLRYTSTA